MTKHVLYATGDPDAPDSIKDRNGDVVLGLCRVCGKGKADLDSPCTPWSAYVGNIGCIGQYASKAAAIRACHEMIDGSARADRDWAIVNEHEDLVITGTRRQPKQFQRCPCCGLSLRSNA